MFDFPWGRPPPERLVGPWLPCDLFCGVDMQVYAQPTSVVVAPSPMVGYHPWNLPPLAACWVRQGIDEKSRGEETMSGELSGKFGQVLKGRNLIILAVTDVVLFLIANIAYGGGNQHGLRNNVSNVAWAVFLVGFVVLVVLALVSIARAMRRRAKAHS
jgi:membrane associated rhomboid family serine protease